MIPTIIYSMPVILAAVTVGLVIFTVTAKLWLRVLFGIVFIAEDKVGIVNKSFVLFGEYKDLPEGSIVALRGEAGLQADTLCPGIHFWYWLWQYSITVEEQLTVKPGTVVVVEAIDGLTIPAGRVLGKNVPCNSYQDARAFLTNQGERGTQIEIIRPGTYRVNKQVFFFKEYPALDIPENKVGIVTVADGLPLKQGEIAAPVITDHQNFQDGGGFIRNNGYRGLQEQVLLAGRYFINPYFATVETTDTTKVEIAHVGVVIACIGTEGQDVTGDTFKHGNLVDKGHKGVWIDPLDPGKYPVNPHTHKVEEVPTANIVLNWATGKNESHKLDSNLSTITVRSADGFAFNLDVSQIIHIPRSDAPKVIARFGNVGNLVTQVLEPTIGNYFRNAAQASDAISFLRQRETRQKEAKESITRALSEYNVIAVDTLIGDIVAPPELMRTLTDRKIAEQEKVTFETQKEAEEVKQKLEQARAIAATQARVVDSEREVTIAEFSAQAEVKKAEGTARSRNILAEADANVIITVGNAEAAKIMAIGESEAEVIKRKIASMDAEKFASVEIAKALASNNIKIVPDILMGSGTDIGSTIVAMLAQNMNKERGK